MKERIFDEEGSRRELPDEQYKEVADLPKNEQERFMDVKEGGFVTRETVVNKELAEEQAYEVEEKLPLDEGFRILYVPIEETEKYIGRVNVERPQHAPFKVDACVELTDSGYILKIGYKRLPIDRVSTGLNDKVVTIRTSETYEGRNYFYTNVSSKDKKKRVDDVGPRNIENQ